MAPRVRRGVRRGVRWPQPPRGSARHDRRGADAHALNVGYVPVISEGVPALTRGRINHVDQNYLRPENYTAANAVLIAAQDTIALAQLWGGGLVAGIDGMRFYGVDCLAGQDRRTALFETRYPRVAIDPRLGQQRAEPDEEMPTTEPVVIAVDMRAPLIGHVVLLGDRA